MLQVLGKCAEVVSETVHPPQGDSFESIEVRLVTGEGRKHYVRLAADFVGNVPTSGEDVVLGVYVRPYVSKKSDSLGYGLTAYSRVA